MYIQCINELHTRLHSKCQKITNQSFNLLKFGQKLQGPAWYQENEPTSSTSWAPLWDLQSLPTMDVLFYTTSSYPVIFPQSVTLWPLQIKVIDFRLSATYTYHQQLYCQTEKSNTQDGFWKIQVRVNILIMPWLKLSAVFFTQWMVRDLHNLFWIKIHLFNPTNDPVVYLKWRGEETRAPLQCWQCNGKAGAI